MINSLAFEYEFEHTDAVKFAALAAESIERNLQKIEDCIFKGDYANLIYHVQNLKVNLTNMKLTEEAAIAAKIEGFLKYGYIDKAIMFCAKLKVQLIDTDQK